MSNTSPITGIGHKNGQWTMHGSDAGLLKAVARKAKTTPREHLHDNKSLVGDVVEYKEPKDESMSPCNLDVTFGDVDSSCAPRLPPTTTPVTRDRIRSVTRRFV